MWPEARQGLTCAARIKSRTKAQSFFPGALSRRLQASTAKGRTAVNRFKHIFRRKPARQKKRGHKRRNLPRHSPIKSAPGPTARRLVKSIKQDSIRFILKHTLGSETLMNTQGFDDKTIIERATVGGRFIAMQLHGSDTRFVTNTRDLFGALFVDEDSHAQNLCGQLLYDTARRARADVTAAPRVEVKAERKGSRFHSHKRVLKIRDAANFNARHNGKNLIIGSFLH